MHCTTQYEGGVISSVLNMNLTCVLLKIKIKYLLNRKAMSGMITNKNENACSISYNLIHYKT